MSANGIEGSENYHSLIVLSPLLLSHGPDMCVIGEDRLPGPGAVVLTPPHAVNTACVSNTQPRICKRAEVGRP